MTTASPLVMIRNEGAKAAVLGAGEPVSYQDLLRGINRYSRALSSASGNGPVASASPTGVLPRVLITGDNSLPWIRAFYAVLQSGMVAVPVDTQATVDDIAYLIQDCTPSCVMTSRAREPAVREALATAASSKGITTRILLLEDLEALDSSAETDQYHFAPDPETVAVIIYTSGTTGSPKGVMLTYNNLVTNMQAVCNPDIKIYTTADRVMMLLPVHHIFPLLGTLMIPLFVGGTIVLCPAMHGEAIMHTLQTHQVSIIIGVPRLYSMIASGVQSRIDASGIARLLYRVATRIKSRGFSRLVFGSVHRKFGGAVRIMVSGGAALDAAVANVYVNLGFDLVEGYGMTEAAPMLTFSRPGKLRPGSPGQALDCVELAIRDEEIVARGPNIMKGYYNRPEETAAILKDGWLHTGDLGDIDADGYLHITGRRKEIIVLSNGKNINPAEIESALSASHPALLEVAVYQDNDRLRALVVADLPRLRTEGFADVQGWVRDQVMKPWNRDHPSYKSLAGIIVTDQELPRTRLGKLRRFQLPALAAELAISQGLAPEAKAAPLSSHHQTPEYAAIRDYLEREKKIKIRPTDNLATDLGLDSLDTIGLQAFLETSYGIPVPIEELAAFDTVADLAAHMTASKTRVSVEMMDWARILAAKLRSTLPKRWPAAPLIGAFLRWTMKFYFRFSARGMSNIPDEPCILVPNHQSFFDGFFIATALRIRQLQRTFFYAKAKHIQGGLFQRLAQRNNIIILDVDHNLKDSILRIAEVLKTQRNVIIFPEGTRTKDGKLGDFKKMFAILSSELNVPIIPVSIRGAWEALPRGARFPKPFRSIRLDFLPAIRPGNLSYDALTELVKTTIQRTLNRKRPASSRA